MFKHNHNTLWLFLLASQTLVLLFTAPTLREESINHSVMLAHYKQKCNATWAPGGLRILLEEQYRCPGELEYRGDVYRISNHEWAASGWGIEGKIFPSQSAAKAYVESQLNYWLRPKAPWYKFWKEFAN